MDFAAVVTVAFGLPFGADSCGFEALRLKQPASDGAARLLGPWFSPFAFALAVECEQFDLSHSLYLTRPALSSLAPCVLLLSLAA